MAPTSDWNLEYTTLDLLMTIYTSTLLTSTDKQSQLLSQITFMPPVCTPNLSLPSLDAVYWYKVGDPTMSIQFSGASNGDC